MRRWSPCGDGGGCVRGGVGERARPVVVDSGVGSWSPELRKEGEKHVGSYVGMGTRGTWGNEDEPKGTPEMLSRGAADAWGMSWGLGGFGYTSSSVDSMEIDL